MTTLRALGLFSVVVAVTERLGECTSNTPVIGVLTVPLRSQSCATFLGRPRPVSSKNDGGGSCFDSTYVKWLEAAGARVTPIRYDLSAENVKTLFSRLNGVLFTGGGENLKNLSSPFMQTAGLLLNLTIEANDNGEHVPLWGTCMGMQALSVLAAGDSSVLDMYAFDSEDLSLPLDPAAGWGKSHLVQSLPRDVVESFLAENITTNFHHDGVRPSAFETNKRLHDFFRIVSTNQDRKGQEFVSTVEAYDYPVYATQWHPERNQFEFWESNDPINHTATAIRAMSALSEFFVSETRHNCRMFPPNETLIYDFDPVPKGTPFKSYVFPPSHLAPANA